MYAFIFLFSLKRSSFPEARRQSNNDLLGRLALVVLLLSRVVRVLPDEEDLRHKDQRHREEAAEEVRQRHETECRILLIAFKEKYYLD